MLHRPITRTNDHPWAVVTSAGLDGLQAVTEGGEIIDARSADDARTAWADLAGHVIHAGPGWRQIVTTTDAREWSGRTWKGYVTSVGHRTGAKVHPGLADVLGDDPVRAVADYARWVRGCGIGLGTPSTVASNLWRSTLDVRLIASHPVDTRELIYGGRKEAFRLGRHDACWYHDLEAAYPHAMSREPYPEGWRPDPSRSLSEPEGIAYARVRVPSAGPGPLPVRDGRQLTWPTRVPAEGWWTCRDLHILCERGGTIERVSDAWRPSGYRDLFGRWWKIVAEGREVTPLAKLVGNKLWGLFAMRTDRQGEITWTDKYANAPEPTDTSYPTPEAIWRGAYVAALTVARVRERLWREAIVGTDGAAMYVDTDGVITPAGVHVEPNTGGPGRWRIDRHMVTVDIAGPQALRWLDREGRWHYSVAGMGLREAKSMFASLPMEALGRMRSPI